MNVFELAAVLKLNSDAYDRGLTKAENAARSTGSKIGSTLASIGKITTGAMIAGTGAIIAGFSKLAMTVVSSYGQYEQLVGGVNKLFGAGGQSLEEYAASVGKTVAEAQADYNKLIAAQSAVMKNAEKAYKTAGMSANEYMETVTGFSAALISSLGGDTTAAVEYADTAIRDMSDNANTFGTNMDAIQHAYQGFAKQNYTMLDNLKLGYGGTKTEMQRLITDAERMNSKFRATRNVNGDLALSFADITEAIHIVQENMNISGTTAKEAAGTAEGSIKSLSAAWKNFVTGLGNSQADIKKLARDVIQNATGALNNIIPIINNVVEAIPTAIDSIIAAIEDTRLLDTIIDSATNIAEKLFGELPGIIDKLGAKLSELIPRAFEILREVLPSVVTSLFDALVSIVENIDLKDLVTGAFDVLNRIIQAIIPRLPELLVQLVVGIVEALPSLFIGVGETIYNIFDSIFGGYDEFDKYNEVLQRQEEAWGRVTDKMERAKEEIGNQAQTWRDHWDRLQSITDETGHVKEGYEGLADFLIGELSEALGIEFDWTGKIINNYSELCDQMDIYMAKKQAELLLAAEEEAYNEAIAKQQELEKQVAEAKIAHAAAQDEVTKAKQAYDAEYDKNPASMRLKELKDNLMEAESLELQWRDTLNTSKDQLKDNYNLRMKYMSDYQAFTEGNYAKVIGYQKDYTGSSKEDLEAYISDLKTNLAVMETNWELANANVKETHSEAAAQDAEYWQGQITSAKDSINKLTQLITKGGKDFSSGFVNSILSGEEDVKGAVRDMTNKAIETNKITMESHSPSKVMERQGKYFVQGYINGIVNMMKAVGDQVRILTSRAIANMDSYSAAMNAGRNVSIGFANGMGAMSGYVWSRARDIAYSALNAIRYTLGIHSPSKVMEWVGNMVSEGLAIGIEETSNLPAKAAQNVAGEITDAMSVLQQDYNMSLNSTTDALNTGTAEQTPKTTNNTITLNVYGSEGQDVEELSEIVIDKLKRTINSEVSVYA